MVVNWLLPPPVVLTILLIIPLPRVVKKGCLIFVRNFLQLRLVAGVQLVHVALIIAGAAFLATSINTYKVTQLHLPETLTPNQKTAVLAKRWREERNFWIAALTFSLWSLLYRFYSLMVEHTALQDRVRELEAALGRAPVGGAGGASAAAATAADQKKGPAGGGKGFLSAGKGTAAPEPSAPPAPPEMLGKLGVEAAPEPKKHK